MSLNVTRVLAFSMMPALFLIPSTAVAQTDCEDGETEIFIEISPDEWENEISLDTNGGRRTYFRRRFEL